MPLACDIGRQERDDILQRFRQGDLRTLVSARVLDEGLLREGPGPRPLTSRLAAGYTAVSGAHTPLPAREPRVLPLTPKVDPTGALIMLAGIYYGAQYGGSATAILVMVPPRARRTADRKGQGGKCRGWRRHDVVR